LIKRKWTYYLLFLGLIFWQQAQAQKYTEYELKSAFIYNFTKFIEWPSQENNNHETFKIGIILNNTMKIVLNEMMRGKRINGKIIEIIYITDLSKIPDCQILFIDGVDNSELIKILKKTKDLPCLTIGNHLDYFCQQGGIINFTPKYYNYRFEINNRQAEWVNLKISSKLLMLSKIISSNENQF